MAEEQDGAAAPEEEQRQYGRDLRAVEDIDKMYPNKPHNHSQTLPFHELIETLFNPLNDNKKKPAGPIDSRKKRGPHGPRRLPPHEARRAIIERFISRWRKEVGDDIYPAFRLIVPEKDRDRAMYRLKEKAIGKLLVKTMKIDKNSEDGLSLLNWKLPGQTMASRMAGDFGGRCFAVISKRPLRIKFGDMTIGEVNEWLDRLAVVQKEEDQLPIFETFYKRMNAEELMWLIRMILRQMKVGATEKTFFDIWHPDAESLYNVSSSLRRVCWELHDPSIRLQAEDRGVTLMQCFQPQLAQFQMHSFQKMVEKMGVADDGATFWIEEKLDGERMQMHMVDDETVPGGKRFGWWSRKAKDYAYLYGSGFRDENGALTRHIKNGFSNGVQNIILDGEMITWDPERDAMVPFGTLKTAAISESRNPFSGGMRPLYRIFDILYLNGISITDYTLRDRRKALEASVNPIYRRMEIHPYEEARSADAIEPLLRKVVAESSEGLVLKNPRSMYRLNERNDDWMKVKPDYMTEFGESLDCVVIGGYYGSGHRGGNLSSFLCGLRVDQQQVRGGASPMKCYSFFKVGGGFTAADYASIRHYTEGRWKDWDIKHPPDEFIELGGGDLQYERPDVWIRPDESVVVSVKAASIHTTDSFRVGLTLRFPRFKKLRTDRDWTSALSIQDFMALKSNAEKERKDKEFKIDDRRKRVRVTRKKDLRIAGNDEVLKTPYAGPSSSIFDGLDFFIMTESLEPEKMSKAQLEQMVKSNGGKIFQHMFFTTEETKKGVTRNVDQYADSYARDVGMQELLHIIDHMPYKHDHPVDADVFREQLHQEAQDLGEPPGWIFSRSIVYVDLHSLAKQNGLQRGEESGGNTEIFDLRLQLASNMVRFAGGRITEDLQDRAITHIIIGDDSSRLKSIRETLKWRQVLPRVVAVGWVELSWAERTLLDEERFIPPAKG
ncbi:DNA ligase (ATP) [Trichoglossum hirsutum]|uniref:DNA ligase n=1 Tax=Trichoglossum hirsutum TaxID=265104 RepID=A0A9P8LH43_9PEZI|nr:DNA ligase (ATP) [Trichoglossum hirsutum]